jgi:hypothetical protein
MNIIQSVTSGFVNFVSEIAAAHQQLGASIAARVGSAYSGAISNSQQNQDRVFREIAPIFAAVGMQMISNQRLSALEFQDHIDRLLASGHYEATLAHVRLNIRLSSIVKDPDAVLDKLARYIVSNPNQPLDVAFFDDDDKRMSGFDAGGLSRHLITDLFLGLLNSKIIRFEKLENGRVLPITAQNTLAPNEKAKWTQVGIILSYCIDRGNLLIGTVFEEGFFDALLTFDASAEGFDAMLPVYKKLKKDDESELQMIHRFERLINAQEWSDADMDEALCMINPDEDEPRKLRKTENRHQDVKSKLYETFKEIIFPKMVKHLEPIRLIKIECEKSLSSRSYTAQSLCTKLQGSIDKDSVRSRIQFSQNLPNKDFFNRWILESTEDELKALIKAATGSIVVGSTPIRVVSSSGSMACFHTCGYQIDLPSKDYPEYLAFKTMLTLSIEYGLAGGFQLV